MTYSEKEIERLRKLYEACGRNVQATLREAKKRGVRATYPEIIKYCESHIYKAHYEKKARDITDNLTEEKKRAREARQREKDEEDKKNYGGKIEELIRRRREEMEKRNRALGQADD